MDFPAGYYWEEIMNNFPDSKVILTLRDPEEWYKSIAGTFLFNIGIGSQKIPFGKWFYNLFYWKSWRFQKMNTKLWGDFFHEDLSKENIIMRFNEHNQNVIKKCPQERLLVFDVKEGWEPLCKFLGVKDIPTEPYPNLRNMEEMNSLITKKNNRGLMMFAGCLITGLLGFGYYLFKMHPDFYNDWINPFRYFRK